MGFDRPGERINRRNGNALDVYEMLKDASIDKFYLL